MRTEACEASVRLDRREKIVEIAVFLFLIVPSLILSFFANQQQGVGFVLVALATIARDLSLVSLILFFLWRDHQPVPCIGLTLRHGWADALLGVVLFVPTLVFTGLLALALRAAGLSSPAAPPSYLTPTGPAQIVLAFVLVVVVAIAEETIFRGYLISRFETVTRSLPWAVVLSALVFSLGHGYEGTAGVATVAVMGIIFALVYVWRQSLVTPMVMHFLQDFLVLVLIPLIGLRM